MIIRTIAAVLVAGILTGCSASKPQPTPPPPPVTTTQEAPPPDALEQLEDFEGKGYERIEGAPHAPRSGAKFQTMLWMHGNDTRIEISNQFTAGKRFEAASIDIRLIDNTGPFTFWCSPVDPRNVSTSVKAFNDAVELMKKGEVKLTSTNKGIIAELPKPHNCWVEYI